MAVPPAVPGAPTPRRGWSSWLVIVVSGFVIACAGAMLTLGTCLTAMSSARLSGNTELLMWFHGGLSAAAIGGIAVVLGLVGEIVSRLVKSRSKRRR